MSASRPDILNRILARKQQEITARRQAISIDSLQQRMHEASPPRGFVASLKHRVEQGEAAVIAEIKKASPSKGVIREDFDVVEIAQSYAAGGASCLSVLTDQDFFQGHEDFLIAARSACELPVIRKDFIVDSAR
jgi:indole-3-glycerol phosphate synthase